MDLNSKYHDNDINLNEGKYDKISNINFEEVIMNQDKFDSLPFDQ